MERAKILKDTVNPINTKVDMSPSPMTYSLIAHWPGKKLKKKSFQTGKPQVG